MLKTNAGPEMNLFDVTRLNLYRCCASIVLSQPSPTFPVSGRAGSHQPGRPTPGRSGPADSTPRPP